MENNATTYQCTPHTKWAVEMYGIFLINEKTGTSSSLGYPQAAIWDLLTRNYSYPEMLRLLCRITTLQTNEAEKLLAESLEKWINSGFLTMVSNHGKPFDHKRV